MAMSATLFHLLNRQWQGFILLACFLLKYCPSRKVHPVFMQTQLNEEI